MTGETRFRQPLGTRGLLKASKLLASLVLTNAPVKHHLPVLKLKSREGIVAKSSPSSSFSNSSSAKKCLNRGNAMANHEGSMDTPAAPRLSTSEGTSETKTGTNFEALSKLSFKCVDPDETKCMITDIGEPPNAAPSINNGEFGGAIGGVCSTNKPLQQENCAEDEVVLEELLNTEDVSEGKDDSLDEPIVPKKPEAKGVVKQAFESLMCEASHRIAAAWSGWQSIRILLPVSVLVLFTVLLWVENWSIDKLDMLPPPT